MQIVKSREYFCSGDLLSKMPSGRETMMRSDGIVPVKCNKGDYLK